MFFRNARFFTLPPRIAQSLREQAFGQDIEKTAALFAECALKPVGPLELTSSGFISPFGEGEAELMHQVGHFVWLTVGTETRKLPPAVVDRELKKKIDAVEKAEGRKIGGRARKRLKDDLIAEMLPKAYVMPGRTNCFLDLATGVLVVDTATRKTAENVASEIRRVFGSFPALPLNAETAPRSVMTGWVAGEPLPEGVALGEECELKDALDGGAVVRCNHQELRGDEISKHLEAGKQVTRLALNVSDHVSFVFCEDLTVRKLKILDGAIESLENTEREDLRAELDARFVLLTAEVARLFAILKAAFAFSENVD